MQYSLSSMKWMIYLILIITIMIESLLATYTDFALLHYKQIFLLKDVASKVPISRTKHDLNIELLHPMGLAYDKVHGMLYFGDWHKMSSVSVYSMDFNREFNNISEPDVFIACDTCDYSFKRITYDQFHNNVIGMDIRKGIFVIDPRKNEAKLIANYSKNEEAVDMYYDKEENKVYSITESIATATIQQWDLKTNSIFTGPLSKSSDRSYKSMAIVDNTIYIAYYSSEDRNCHFIKFPKKNFASIEVEEEYLFTVEKCYPHSLLIDEAYFYWSDHNRDAILRQNRKDYAIKPEIITKLKHRVSKYGYHYVYDLVPLPRKEDTASLSDVSLNDQQYTPKLYERPLSSDKSLTEHEVTENIFNSNSKIKGKPIKTILTSSPSRKIVNEVEIKPHLKSTNTDDKDASTRSTSIGKSLNLLIDTSNKTVGLPSMPSVKKASVSLQLSSRLMKCETLMTYQTLACVFISTTIILCIIVVVLLVYLRKISVAPKFKGCKRKKIFSAKNRKLSGRNNNTSDIEDSITCEYSCSTGVNIHGRGYHPALLEKSSLDNKKLLDYPN